MKLLTVPLLLWVIVGLYFGGLGLINAQIVDDARSDERNEAVYDGISFLNIEQVKIYKISNGESLLLWWPLGLPTMVVIGMIALGFGAAGGALRFSYDWVFGKMPPSKEVAWLGPVVTALISVVIVAALSMVPPILATGTQDPRPVSVLAIAMLAGFLPQNTARVLAPVVVSVLSTPRHADAGERARGGVPVLRRRPAGAAL